MLANPRQIGGMDLVEEAHHDGGKTSLILDVFGSGARKDIVLAESPAVAADRIAAALEGRNDVRISCAGWEGAWGVVRLVCALEGARPITYC